MVQNADGWRKKVMRSFIGVLWCLVLVFVVGCKSDAEDYAESVKRLVDKCDLQFSVLEKDKVAGDQCLKREEAAKAAASKEPEELPSCDDGDLVDSGCMEGSCPYDPKLEFPGKKLTDAEVLQFSWHHVEYENRECRRELEDALDWETSGVGCFQWSKYTPEL